MMKIEKSTEDYLESMLMKKEECRGTKYTFSGSVYFERMKQLGLYTSDLQEIKARAAKLGAAGILSQKVC